MRAYFCVASLWSALLLFQVQPMLGKRLLPWFGGSPSTWTTCLVFFQVALLLGYAIADLIVRRAPARLRPVLFALLPLSALAWLPLGPTSLDRPIDGGAPALAILTLLVSHVGVPYLALSTAAPLLQHAYERTTGQAPYPLYAWSNAGSLIGLVGYPLLLEPWLHLAAQSVLWSWGFCAFAASFLVAALLLQRASAAGAPPALPAEPVQPRSPFLVWVVLACVPSALLLAVTTYITVDVAVVPFLWVVPLSLYLLTFIVAFGSARPSPRGFLLAAFAFAMAGLGVGLFGQGSAPLWQQLAFPLLTLTTAAWLLHGELVRARPAAERMSSFYLAVALGGALGAVLVALLAPVVFNGVYELPLSTIAAAVVVTVIVARTPPSQERRRHLLLCYFALGLGVPLVGATVWVQGQDRSRTGTVIEQQRSFFGVLRVTDLPDVRLLSHGRIRHGMEFLDPKRRREPTLYYGPESGIGRVMRLHAAERPRHIGVVGLGTGTLSVYAKAGDELRFYELNPAVADVAQRRFHYLDDARAAGAQVSIVFGDARLRFERESPQAFDVLALDAFSSDSVPAHLLTVEAFTVHLRHLRPDGVIAAHVSNRHVAVERVVAGTAAAHGLQMRLVESPRDIAHGLTHARWALLARSSAVLAPLVEGAAIAVPWGTPLLWTDDFTNLLGALR